MIATFPTEIVETIAAHLSARDLLHFRLTCSELYEKTLRSCANTLFHTITTDLSRRDLEKLDAVAQGSQLATSVRTLRLDHCSHSSDDEGLGDGFSWTRNPAGEQLILPLDGLEMLRNLLEQRLKNCRSFQIHCWNYEVGSRTDRLDASDCLELILMLATYAQHMTKSIEVCTPGDGQSGGSGILLNQDKLPVATLSMPGVLKMLNNLDKVKFHLIHQDQLITSGWYTTAFSALSSLTSLSLNLNLYADQKVAEDLLTSIHCPSLESLNLSNFWVAGDIFRRILRPWHMTLRALKIRGMSMVIDGVDSWQSFISDLPNLSPILESVELDLLTNIYAGERKAHVHFTALPGLQEYEDMAFTLKGPKRRYFEYQTLEVPRLKFRLASHRWKKEKRIVVAIRYTGLDMLVALEVIKKITQEIGER